MFQTDIVEEIKTHILCSVTFFLGGGNHAFYDITRKNILERGRPQMTIWCMRIACWITKTTHTLRICNTYSFSTAAIVSRTRLNVTFIRTWPVFLKPRAVCIRHGTK